MVGSRLEMKTSWSERKRTLFLLFCPLVVYQAIGGAVWHGVKGFRNSPYGERRIGAMTAIKARAPVLGGNFGVWGGLFSTFDCAVKGIRKKEDPYNASRWCSVLFFFSFPETW